VFLPVDNDRRLALRFLDSLRPPFDHSRTVVDNEFLLQCFLLRPT
jgi:hypothetical protein